MDRMNPKEIKTHPSFESLFPINPTLLAKIEQDMRNGNYDLSQPVILATWEGQKEPVVIDGHTRLQAAINEGIEQVPVWLHEFDTEQEAVKKAIKLQCNRRNMTDAELLACIEALDHKRERGGDRRSEAEKSKPPNGGIEKTASSAEELAETLRISARKVERGRTILNQADAKTLAEVKTGQTSIHRACHEIQEKRKQTAANRKKTSAKGPAPDEKQELEQAPEAVGQTHEPTLPEMHYQNSLGRMVKFFLPEWQHTAFIRLGGFVETHLTKAVALYLESLGFQPPEDDDDEYFDPDTYIDE